MSSVGREAVDSLDPIAVRTQIDVENGEGDVAPLIVEGIEIDRQSDARVGVKVAGDLE